MEIRRLSSEEWPLWRQVRLRALADSPDSFGSSLADWSEVDDSRWLSRLVDVPFNVVAIVSVSSKMMDREMNLPSSR